jgi:spore coat protein CotF
MGSLSGLTALGLSTAGLLADVRKNQAQKPKEVTKTNRKHANCKAENLHTQQNSNVTVRFNHLSEPIQRERA